MDNFIRSLQCDAVILHGGFFVDSPSQLVSCFFLFLGITFPQNVAFWKGNGTPYFREIQVDEIL